MFWQGRLSTTLSALTSSSVSSCGVAALSSESFCEPAIVSMFFLVTSRFFLCLWASFLTWPSALPELNRRTGLVSHFRKVFPGRLGPGELWGPSVWLEPGCRASLLDTDKVSKGEQEKRKRRLILIECTQKGVISPKNKNTRLELSISHSKLRQSDDVTALCSQESKCSNQLANTNSSDFSCHWFTGNS